MGRLSVGALDFSSCRLVLVSPTQKGCVEGIDFCVKYRLHEMFDENFCVYLEYALSGVLSKSSNFYYRGCWCDGIRLPENHLKHSRAYILKYRMVETEAWIYAENFKEEKHRWPTPYEMRIFFGDESINKLNARERLEDCVPTSDPDSWIRIDMVERWIDIQLP